MLRGFDFPPPPLSRDRPRVDRASTSLGPRALATNWSEGAKLSSGQGTVLAIVVAAIIGGS
jgi:hypothetical protein